LLKYDFTGQSLYSILRNNYGLHLTRSATVIESCLANPAEAELLRLPRPAALLVSTQTTYLDSGLVIEVTRSAFNPEKYKLHMHS
jgi:GntR family transcriptional regulator